MTDTDDTWRIELYDANRRIDQLEQELNEARSRIRMHETRIAEAQRMIGELIGEIRRSQELR